MLSVTDLKAIQGMCEREPDNPPDQEEDAHWTGGGEDDLSDTEFVYASVRDLVDFGLHLSNCYFLHGEKVVNHRAKPSPSKDDAPKTPDPSTGLVSTRAQNCHP